MKMRDGLRAVADCSTLLGIVPKLKVEDGSTRRLRNLNAAFVAICNDDMTKQLKERLSHAQTQIALDMCRISVRARSFTSPALIRPPPAYTAWFISRVIETSKSS